MTHINSFSLENSGTDTIRNNTEFRNVEDILRRIKEWMEDTLNGIYGKGGDDNNDYGIEPV